MIAALARARNAKASDARMLSVEDTKDAWWSVLDGRLFL